MIYLYGNHACYAALSNPHRNILKIWVTDPEKIVEKERAEVEVVSSSFLSSRLPDGAVHQGIAMKVRPLPILDIYDIPNVSKQEPSCFLALDQITDPQNVGTLFRSAAALGAQGVIMTTRHAPHESGVLAKASCGGIEHVSRIEVKNLSQSLETLKEKGYWIVTLSEKGTVPLHRIDLKAPVILVIGSEGKGVRHLTTERSDFCVYLPTDPKLPTLNAAQAATLALYDIRRQNLA